MERFWAEKPIRSTKPNKEAKLQMRRFLRAAVYGTYAFDRRRMAHVYDRHYRAVTEYFEDRPESLLVMDITRGEGWEKLCPFLGKAVLDAPFPNIKKKSKVNS